MHYIKYNFYFQYKLLVALLHKNCIINTFSSIYKNIFNHTDKCKFLYLLSQAYFINMFYINKHAIY